MFGSKHYKAVSRTLRHSKPVDAFDQDVWQKVVTNFVQDFTAQDQRFNAPVFLAACDSKATGKEIK